MADSAELTDKEKYMNGIVQIQERYITELIRNKIHAELQTKAYEELAGEFRVKETDLRKQIEQLEDLVKQSTVSITTLTAEKEKLVSMGDTRINLINSLGQELEDAKHRAARLETINHSQQREVERLNAELLTTCHTNRELESALSNQNQHLMSDETGFVKKQRPKTKKPTTDDTNEPLTTEIDAQHF